jgi:hypothetical protein
VRGGVWGRGWGETATDGDSDTIMEYLGSLLEGGKRFALVEDVNSLMKAAGLNVDALLFIVVHSASPVHLSLLLHHLFMRRAIKESSWRKRAAAANAAVFLDVACGLVGAARGACPPAQPPSPPAQPPSHPPPDLDLSPCAAIAPCQEGRSARAYTIDGAADRGRCAGSPRRQALRGSGSCCWACQPGPPWRWPWTSASWTL